MTENNKLRVATWNIKHAAPSDGYIGRPGRFSEACKELGRLNLDILTLQEVDRRVWRSGLRDLARLAVEATGMTPYFGKAMGANLGAAINPFGMYGNLLLVSGSIANPADIVLDGDYKRLSFRGSTYQSFREPRNAIIADINVQGVDLAVATTHIGGRQRKLQLGRTLDALFERSGQYVMTGDLNTSHQEAKRWFRRYGMEAADAPPTCPMPEPYRHIDHIAVKGLEIQRAYTIPLPVSDHLALVAELSLTKTVYL